MAGTTPNPVGNALTNDKVNGQPATLGTNGNATIGSITPATPIGGGPVPTLDPLTGDVTVPPGTPAGAYTITYTLCEKLNPSNCTSTQITVNVNAPTIVAGNDTMPTTNGLTGGTPALNVLLNDSINALPAVTTGPTPNTTLVVKTPATALQAGKPVPSLSAAGVVTVLAGTPAGNYTIVYTLCDAVNPTNCKDATVTIPVTAAPIVANPDVYTVPNGATGAPTGSPAGNVLSGATGDTLNSSPVVIGDINLTITTPAQPVFGAPAGNTNVPVLNTATGEVTVPANTPAGDYTITYKICEKLNPTNCSETTAKVTVGKAPIVANDDTYSGVNGANTTVIGNVVAGTGAVAGSVADTLNSAPATLGAPGNTTLAITTAAIPKTPGAPVPSLNTTTGEVTVPAGTPAGPYTIVYNLCEKLNPTNCDPATITINVAAPLIDAKDDTYTAVNGATGNANVGNVVTGAGTGSVADTLNALPTTIAATNLTVTVPAAAVAGAPAGAPVPVIDTATGNLVVPPGTPAGVYNITYKLCEKLNPLNCDTAIAKVTVDPSPIVAENDSYVGVNGATGNPNVGNALLNDKINGIPASVGNAGNATISVNIPATSINGAPVPVLDAATGVVSVPPGTPAGTYAISYKLCEKLNPTNCKDAIITVKVEPSVVEAVNDTYTGVNGSVGNPNVGNALSNDKVNGVTATAGPSGNAALAISTPAQSINGGPVPTLDVATGVVSVPPGTPAGNYVISYKLCEKLNPTNCKDATVTVPLAGIDTVKAVGVPLQVGVGKFEIPYNVVVGNLGTVTTYNVQANDNLTASHPAPAVVTIKPGSYSVAAIGGACTANPAFTGTTDTRLLAGTDDLSQGQACEIKFVAVVDYGTNQLPKTTFNNALASAVGSDSATPNPGHTGITQDSTTGKVTGSVLPAGAVASDISTNDPSASPAAGSAPGTPPARPKLPTAVNADSAGGNPTPVVLAVQDDGALSIRKSTITKIAAAGDVVEYSVIVSNSGSNPVKTKVSDTPPIGFEYVSGSVKLNGAASGAPIKNGAELIFEIGNVPAKSSVELRYQMKLGDEVVGGDASNCVGAFGVNTLSGTDKESGKSCASVIVQTGLFLEKRANVTNAELGDSIEYSLRVKSVGGRTNNVTISDNLPLGFKLIEGTVRVIRTSGLSAMANPAGSPGPALTFNVGSVANKEIVEIRYRVRLGIGSDLGDGINRAQAKAPFATASLIASAKVLVTRGVFTREACVAGKVFVDCNQNDGVDKGERNSIQDKGEPGIPGVRLYMEDGTNFTTDENGQYSICGIRAITHVMQVDTTTMPVGSVMGITSNRNLGDGVSLMMNIKAGELYRADFNESSCTPAILKEVEQRRLKGVTSAIPVNNALKAPPVVQVFDSKAQELTRPPICETNPAASVCATAGGAK